MIPTRFFEVLECPHCRFENGGEIDTVGDGLICTGCRTTYPILDQIIDFAGPVVDRMYRTERLDNVIAGAYTALLPIMSATVWRCPPLRFVDWTHMTVGRALGGRFLALPVTTGSLIEHVWGDYLQDLEVVAADLSWKMLRKAQQRFRRMGVSALLVRADPDNLPFAAASFRSVLSINGLHGFDQRARSLRQMDRILEPGGTIGGSTLIRGQGLMADQFHNFYERQGITPLLRSREFVLEELHQLEDVHVLHESYGAVMFFTVQKD